MMVSHIMHCYQIFISFIVTAVIATIMFEPISVGEEDGAAEVCVSLSNESELRSSSLILSTRDDSGNGNLLII